MRKLTLLALSLLTLGSPVATTAQAQELSPTASTELYDFSAFADGTLLDLFYQAKQKGRVCPTLAEFEEHGILPSDIAFIRSHVKRGALLPFDDRVVQDTYAARNLWCNLPMDVGQDGRAGYPNGKFAADVFSMWNYTNLFGSWNHSFFRAPGAWVDAAHKNGSMIMSGIKFFESWGGGDGSWTAYCTTKNADGTFKYAEPLINCLMYFGADGINFNWEDNSYSKPDVVAFHKALFKCAKEKGYDDFQLGLYTAVSVLTASNANALFGGRDGRTATTMLNYSGGDFSTAIGPSVKAAETAMGTADGLYSGVWIVNMNRRWKSLDANTDAHKCGICLWGEHGQSRFMSYNSGADAYEAQENYQRLLERGFSGGNRNPLTRPAVSNTGNNWEFDSKGTPPLSTFCGLAEFIPERSAIQGKLPFQTHFNLGNGDRYNYKGRKTAEAWYNMANQDLVPTWRWLVVNPGTLEPNTSIQPEFTHSDAYTGGTCLSLTGTATEQGTDVLLYKTNLAAAAQPKVKIAVKSGQEGTLPSLLSVIVRTDLGEWVEVPVGDVSGSQWQEKELALPGVSAGDAIERIGLRVRGERDGYKLLVGKLEITDGTTQAPAAPCNLTAEVKEETRSSMSLKLVWDVDCAQTGERAAYGLLYNDEAGIDHFEVLYKNGEQGRVSEVGRTTQWATFVNDLLFESTADDPYIGVRAVGTDLKTYSPVEWIHVARAEQQLLPAYDPDTYGQSAMDPACEGADIARKQRYLTDVTTTGAEVNLDYHADGPVADGSQYVGALTQTLKVRQGQEVELYVKAFDTTNDHPGTNSADGLRWCFAGGWMDLDGSGTFNPDDITANPSQGERLFFLGSLRAATDAFETQGIRHKFTVPTDAVPGKSRLRIVFSDAWFQGMFQPTGLHAKGFTIDFDVEIVGDNTPRPTPPDAHDQGLPEEPEGLGAAPEPEPEPEPEPDAIKAVGQQGVSTARLVDGAISLSGAEKVWLYTADGRLVSFRADSPKSLSTKSLIPGSYVVRMQQGRVIRSAKVVVK